MFAPPFSKTELWRNWEAVVGDKVRLAVKRIKGEAGRTEKGLVDVYKWWIFLASDVVAHVVFGESFHMLESGKANPL
jgi:ABC-type Co2+ transport system permease subunit